MPGRDAAPAPGTGYSVAVTNALLPGLGGPMGRHARGRGIWFNPTPWALLAATGLFLLLFLRHVPCVQVLDSDPVNAYIRACYSDVQTTFLSQGFGQGATPLGTDQLVFSPLVAVLVLASTSVAALLGAPIHPGATLQEQVDASVAFFGVTAVLLFACFLVLVIAMLRLGRPARPGLGSWDALLIAGSPVVLAVGLISWELVPLALTAVGLLLFARRRVPEAGIVVGLAACAGTMPIGVLLAVVVACGLRSGRRTALAFGGAAVVTFFAVHLPLLVSNFDRVYAFYHHEINKEASYGSLWYLASLLGLGTRHTGSLAFVLLALFLGILIAYLYVKGRRPRVGTLVAAVLFATALAGPAYPPQTALWLLFALVLARPFRAELIAFTLAEVTYCLAVWGWIGGALTTSQSGPYLLYWVAIAARAGVQAWLLSEVLADMSAPSRDRMRAPDLADPIGGVLNDAAPPMPPAPMPEDIFRDPAPAR